MSTGWESPIVTSTPPSGEVGKEPVGGTTTGKDLCTKRDLHRPHTPSTGVTFRHGSVTVEPFLVLGYGRGGSGTVVCGTEESWGVSSSVP